MSHKIQLIIFFLLFSSLSLLAMIMRDLPVWLVRLSVRIVPFFIVSGSKSKCFLFRPWMVRN